MERWKTDFISMLKDGKPAHLASRLAGGKSIAEAQLARDTDPEFASLWDQVSDKDAGGSITGTRVLSPQSLEALLWSQCDDEEIAGYFGMNVAAFKAAVDADKELKLIYEVAPAGGRAAIKRAQMESALEGNTQMLTWTGKQHLGQAEKSEQKVTVEDKRDPIEIARRVSLLLSQGGLKLPVIDAEIVEEPLSVTGPDEVPF